MICRSLRFAKKQVFHISLFWIGWALLCWLKRWYLWRDILIKLKRDSVWLTFTNLTLLKPLGLKVLPISPILRTWSRNLFLLSSEISWKVYVSNLVDCNQNFTKEDLGGPPPVVIQPHSWPVLSYCCCCSVTPRVPPPMSINRSALVFKASKKEPWLRSPWSMLPWWTSTWSTST